MPFRFLILSLVTLMSGLWLMGCAPKAAPAEIPSADNISQVTSEPVVTEVAAQATLEVTIAPSTTVANTVNAEDAAEIDPGLIPLPQREGPRTQTSGTVPHVQLGVTPDQTVNDELFRLAFTLPGVEDRPTIVSLPGARGMWLSEELSVVNPQVIVNGREFAHIHPDGSLHAALPFTRAMELTEKGWGERHPWADDREGWEGFVMLYTPLTMEELEITFQLIVESYNHVTGETYHPAEFN